VTKTEQHLPAATKGLVLHGGARYYDIVTSILLLGRERAFRERLINLAGIKEGETVLDVGCGTGTLAIAAQRRVGQAGTVYGIDASSEMIGKANKKAQKAKLEIAFNVELVEALPFPDAHFDAVLSTLMLHHLPQQTREQCAREIRRVLKPGERVLAVDFGGGEQNRGILAHLHRRHGHIHIGDIIALLTEAGLSIAETGAVGIMDLHFVLAKAE
jgi:ubiquinone/menaquinone biosynthesis C-methylase UbiE